MPKRRKKKVCKVPEEKRHWHKNERMGPLKYYAVDASGNVTNLRLSCPACGPGTYMGKFCLFCSLKFFQFLTFSQVFTPSMEKSVTTVVPAQQPSVLNLKPKRLKPHRLANLPFYTTSLINSITVKQ